MSSAPFTYVVRDLADAIEAADWERGGTYCLADWLEAQRDHVIAGLCASVGCPIVEVELEPEPIARVIARLDARRLPAEFPR